MTILPLLLALVAATDVPLVDGGFCTGGAWVPVSSNAKVTRSTGPDFDVTYVDGADDSGFGVYVGGYPQVSADTGKPLLETDGMTVRPSHAGGKFQGYIVSSGDYLKYHFFGPAFAGTDADQSFFRRVQFDKDAAERCNKPAETVK